MSPKGLRRHTLQLSCQFQEDRGLFLPKYVKNKFPTFMYGCSEEVPNLKFQLLYEEIIFLGLNKRIKSPGLELMAALEGGPAEGKGGSPKGPDFLPEAHLTCWILCIYLLPVLVKMQHPHLTNPIYHGNPFPGFFLHCKRN